MMRGSRGTLLLVGGQALGQASMLAVVPLLTRAYGPSVLGLYQVAMAVATTAQPALTLRAEFVLPAFAFDRNAAVLMRRGLQTTLGVSAATATVGLGLGMAGFQTPAEVCVMTGFIAAALGLTVLDNALLIRRGARGRLAARNAIAGVVTALLQFGLIVLGLPIVYVAVALLIGRIVGIVCTRRARDRWDLEDGGVEPRPYTWRRASLAVGSGVAASATGQAMTASAGPLFGASASGFVGVAQRVAGTPIGLLGQGLSQALQTQSAPLIRAQRAGLTRLVTRQILALSVISAALAAAVILLAPPLAVPVLGAGWEEAGRVTAVLAVPIAFQLLIGPLMPLLPMLGHERLLFMLQLVRLAVAITAIFITAGLSGSLLWTAAAYGAGTVLGYLLMIVVLIRQTRRFDVEASGT